MHKRIALIGAVGIFAGLTLLTHINIGVRYYLPAYLFFILLSAAALLDVLLRSPRRYLAMTVAVAAIGWMGLEAWRTYPDYVPYLNQLAFARPHVSPAETSID